MTSKTSGVTSHSSWGIFTVLSPLPGSLQACFDSVDRLLEPVYQPGRLDCHRLRYHHPFLRSSVKTYLKNLTTAIFKYIVSTDNDSPFG